MHTPTPGSVRYLDGRLSIHHLDIDDPATVLEAHHWAGGLRGPSVSDAELTAAELDQFIVQAVAVGARAISAAGTAQDTFNLAALVDDVGRRTSQAADEMSSATSKVVSEATASLEKAARDARIVITEAGGDNRTAFAANVTEANRRLTDEIGRLFGGENPELLVRLAPLLATFGRDLDDKVSSHMTSLIATAVRQFDPADPASPMAQQTRALTDKHAELRATVSQNHQILVDRLEALTTAIKVEQAERLATTTALHATPRKGAVYADAMHALLAEIAAGLGDEYVDTSSSVGAIRNCRKGDGLFVIGGDTRLMIEMSDAKDAHGNDYLAEGERNRGAVASLGLTRHAMQLKGRGVVCYSARRVVMAFDPDTDDPELLRTVVQLVRLGALAAAARSDDAEVATAVTKVDEALQLLSRIDGIKKQSGVILTAAGKIQSESDAVHIQMQSLLSQARSALAAVASDPVAA